MKRTCYVGDLNETHAGQTVTLQGWVNRRRDLGGLIFLELRDRSGVVQVEVEPGSPAFAEANTVRAEYVVEVEGRFQPRPEGQRKGGLGDYEVMASRVKVLNAAKTPPFELEKGDAVAEDIRLKYRYLDLRRGEMQRGLMLRSKAVAAVTSFLDAEGFVRGGVVELDDFGVDAGGAAVEHDEAVELENHLGAALEAAGHVDGADVAVDAGALVLALGHDGGAEGVVDLGVGAGEGVVEADAEGDVLRDDEGLG